ncbi:MAG: hypothetical protein COA68_12300, partial [Oceanobacter sp.]
MTATKTTTTTNATGGDLTDCWSAAEIDRLVGNAAALPADTFWKWRNGGISAAQIQQRLAKNRTTVLRLIIWMRHHWVCAELQQAPSPTTTAHLAVYDSATSLAVRKDLHKLAREMGWPEPSFVTCPQQLRGSNECGIYATFFLLSLAAGRPITERTLEPRPSVRRAALENVESPQRFVAAVGAMLDGTRREQLRQGCHNPYAATVIPPRREVEAPRTTELAPTAQRATPHPQMEPRTTAKGAVPTQQNAQLAVAQPPLTDGGWGTKTA